MNRHTFPFAFILAAAVLTLAAPARAAERPHVSRGTAQIGPDGAFVGTGNATHLGRYDEEGFAKFTPVPNSPFVEVDARSTYVAADGDELYAVITGRLNGLTGVITATVTYVGGTGRFTYATGTATLSGQLGANGSITVAVKGTIDY
jgi:hypothetical protein